VKVPRFLAQIQWVADREAPAGAQLIHPVFFSEDGIEADAWSLVLTLTDPVPRGTKQSSGVVHLLVPWAPHDHLYTGRTLPFYEGKTLVARLLVGEPAGFLEVEA
jgi:hypothetical protein